MKHFLQTLLNQSVYLLIVATHILFSVAYVVAQDDSEVTEMPEPEATVVACRKARSLNWSILSLLTHQKAHS